MKHFISILLFFIIYHCTVFAQNQTDSIELKRSAGIKYYQNGIPLTQKQVLLIMKTENIAYNEMRIAREKSVTAIIFGAAGGFLVGYQVGKMLTGAITNKLWIGVGGALMIISIPVTAQSHKHAKNAVNFYNSGLTQSAIHKIGYNIVISGNGLGISMRF